MTVESIIDDVLRLETGGVPWDQAKAALHRADRGGWTRGGVTARALGEYRRLGRPATRAELNAMTETDARTFYRRRYVGPFEDVYDPLRALLVDWAVTSWHDDPTKAVQIALQRRGIYDGAIDGIFGRKTRAALLRDPEPQETYRDVFKARVEFYVELGRRDPIVRVFMAQHPESQLTNQLGWVRRALEFTP